MLRNLHVKNLALIDEIEVEFEPGLNILTGETGAGKSIILGSVALALGGRYSADMLRKGSDFGLVELTFTVKQKQQAELLKSMDIFPEEGQIVLSRKLMEGRSVSKINGETVNMKTLKRVSGILIDIHGQHEHQSLLHTGNHISILDDYAKEKTAPLVSRVEEAYQTYTKCKKQLESSRRDEKSREKETELLEFEVHEIKSAQLVPEEDVHLEEQYHRMVHAKKLIERVMEAYRYTGGDSDAGNASDSISRGLRALQDTVNYDPQAALLCEQLMQLDGLLNDFNRDLSSYAKNLEFEESEFAVVEERLNVLNHLKNKYGRDVSDILAYCEEKEEKLLQMEDYDAYIQSLTQEFSESREALLQASKNLSKIRKQYAASFSEQIKQGLLDLNFLEVQFAVRFKEAKECSANGMDEVEFMISTNPGEPVKPLADIASGGELSRIMLVIKTVLADKDEIETLIFDEIDSGISGRTAGKVAEKMALIGNSRQVICITHLAQIASMADAHFVIQKDVENNVTKTGIYLLDEQASVEELARILGGTKITESIRQSAVEMKKLAKRTK